MNNYTHRGYLCEKYIPYRGIRQVFTEVFSISIAKERRKIAGNCFFVYRFVYYCTSVLSRDKILPIAWVSLVLDTRRQQSRENE